MLDGCNGHRLNYRDYKSTTRNSLTHLIARVNDDLAKRPFQGNVTSVETVLVPEFLPEDTGCLFWKQTPNQLNRSVAFLRIFYRPGPNYQSETIGLKSILPESVGCGYEPFSALFSRATEWAKKEPHTTRVTNFKSYNIPCTRSTLEKDANSCIHPSDLVQPLPQTSTSISSSQQYFQVLRIFFVRRSRPSSSDSTDASGAPCTGSHRGFEDRKWNVKCAVFTPVQTSAGRNVHATFERMKQTTLKICAWMLQSAVDVRCVETYIGPMLPSTANHSLPEITVWSHWDTKSPSKCLSNEKKFLMHIRVYFESRSTSCIVDQHPELQGFDPNHQQSRRFQEQPLPARTAQEPIVINPSIPTHLPGSVETAMMEEQRKIWEKQRRWRNRKLRLLMSCILMFAISIPAGVLFYFNAIQTPD